jgi:hypothetical protein
LTQWDAVLAWARDLIRSHNDASFDDADDRLVGSTTERALFPAQGVDDEGEFVSGLSHWLSDYANSRAIKIPEVEKAAQFLRYLECAVHVESDARYYVVTKVQQSDFIERFLYLWNQGDETYREWLLRGSMQATEARIQTRQDLEELRDEATLEDSEVSEESTASEFEESSEAILTEWDENVATPYHPEDPEEDVPEFDDE